jgi:hypothetical protein
MPKVKTTLYKSFVNQAWWVDPNGRDYPLGDKTHGEWACEYLRIPNPFGNPQYLSNIRDAQEELMGRGWVRVFYEVFAKAMVIHSKARLGEQKCFDIVFGLIPPNKRLKSINNEYGSSMHMRTDVHWVPSPEDFDESFEQELEKYLPESRSLIGRVSWRNFVVSPKGQVIDIGFVEHAIWFLQHYKSQGSSIKDPDEAFDTALRDGWIRVVREKQAESMTIVSHRKLSKQALLDIVFDVDPSGRYTQVFHGWDDANGKYTSQIIKF